MADPGCAQHKVERIHGKPEDWLRDFIEHALRSYSGRILGACIHLEILEPDGDGSGCVSWYDWPSSAQLQGRLQTTVYQLAERHCHPDREKWYPEPNKP